MADAVPEMITVKAYAQATGLPVSVVKGLVQRGVLKAYPVARLKMIPRTEVARVSEILEADQGGAVPT